MIITSPEDVKVSVELTEDVTFTFRLLGEPMHSPWIPAWIMEEPRQ